jgi:hypothetical protein
MNRIQPAEEPECPAGSTVLRLQMEPKSKVASCTLCVIDLIREKLSHYNSPQFPNESVRQRSGHSRWFGGLYFSVSSLYYYSVV